MLERAGRDFRRMEQLARNDGGVTQADRDAASSAYRAAQANVAAAQEERPAWSLPIEEVPVVTRRTMKEIGVQRTQLDSTVLHDNISLSMADVLTQNLFS